MRDETILTHQSLLASNSKCSSRFCCLALRSSIDVIVRSIEPTSGAY